MSILNFSEYLYVRVFNADESVKISTMNFEKCELAHIRMKVFLMGTLASGSIKLVVYPKNNTSTRICESSIVNLVDVGANFLGFIRFDFQKTNMTQGEYDVYAVLSGYTRGFDLKYFSLVYDFPIPVYDNGGVYFNNHPIALEAFGYQ